MDIPYEKWVYNTHTDKWLIHIYDQSRGPYAVQKRKWTI